MGNKASGPASDLSDADPEKVGSETAIPGLRSDDKIKNNWVSTRETQDNSDMSEEDNKALKENLYPTNSEEKDILISVS